MTDVPIFDALADEFRWCVYCKADCWPEPENRRHSADCPQSTGLYPVDQDMVDRDARCGYGDGTCGHVFQLGEVYMHTEVEVDGGDTYATVACVGCALREAIA